MPFSQPEASTKTEGWLQKDETRVGRQVPGQRGRDGVGGDREGGVCGVVVVVVVVVVVLTGCEELVEGFCLVGRR